MQSGEAGNREEAVLLDADALLQQTTSSLSNLASMLNAYALYYQNHLPALEKMIEKDKRKLDKLRLGNSVSLKHLQNALRQGPFNLAGREMIAFAATILLHFCTTTFKDYDAFRRLLKGAESRKISRAIVALREKKIIQQISLVHYEIAPFGFELLEEARQSGGGS